MFNIGVHELQPFSFEHFANFVIQVLSLGVVCAFRTFGKVYPKIVAYDLRVWESLK